MESLHVAGKAVRLCIDDDESRVIEFYPNDVAFVESFYALAGEFEEKRKEVKERVALIRAGDGSKFEKAGAELAVTREAFQAIRDGVDKIFGAGAAETIFGDRDNLGMVARFFRGVTPYIQRARQQELDRYMSDVGADEAVME